MSASSDDAIKLDPEVALELERLSLLSREQLAETLAQSVVQLKKLREELRGAELENHYLRELLRLAARNPSKNQQLFSKNSALTGGHWRIRYPKNENKYFGDCR